MKYEVKFTKVKYLFLCYIVLVLMRICLVDGTKHNSHVSMTVSLS